MLENHENQQEQMLQLSMQAYAQNFRDLIAAKVGPEGKKLLELHAQADLEQINGVLTALFEGIKKILDNISISEAAPFHVPDDVLLHGKVVPAGTRRLMLHNLRNIIGNSRLALLCQRFLAQPQESIDTFLLTDKKVKNFVCLTSMEGITSFSFFKECLTDFLSSPTVHVTALGEWERYGDVVQARMSFPTLTQCVLELVENSIKSYYHYEHDPETGEDLEVPVPIARPQDIHVALELTETAFVCTVRDTGKGIAPEDLPHIFQNRFTRTRGSGFGLYSIKQSLLQHGGFIDMDPAKKEGSAFVLHIPVIPKHVPPNSHPPSVVPLQIQKR